MVSLVGYKQLIPPYLLLLCIMPSDSVREESALVLYDESVVPPHYKPEKSFTFGKNTISIKQNWAEQGVAGVVWDAAIVLCEYIVANAKTFVGKNVLELGSGTGLAGICAYMEGASVTLTDKQDSIQILRDNVDLNTHEEISNTDTQSRGDNFEYKTALGECSDEAQCTSNDKYEQRPAVEVEVLDWSDRYNHLLKWSWDIVIAADIIYIESSFDDLLNTMKSLKYSQMIFSCRLRYPKDHAFIRRAKEIFDVNLLLYDRSRDIKIFSFQPLNK